MRVTELSPQDVDELFSLREVLERFAVHTAPPTPGPLALAELADRLDAMQRAAATGAALEQAEAHRQFHVALVAMAGHRHLLQVYEPVIIELQLYMAANLRGRHKCEHRRTASGDTNGYSTPWRRAISMRCSLRLATTELGRSSTDGFCRWPRQTRNTHVTSSTITRHHLVDNRQVHYVTESPDVDSSITSIGGSELQATYTAEQLEPRQVVDLVLERIGIDP